MLHIFKIETEELSLIPIMEEDIEQMRIWRNSDNIRKYFIYSNVISVEEQEKWFDKHKVTENDFIFMINEKKYLKRKIGTLSIYNFSEDEKKAELGRFFIGDDEAHGNGYGLLSVKLACNIAFNHMGIEKLILEVLEDNDKAYHIYEKSGFKRVGNKSLNGKNLIEMEINKDEFIKFINKN